MRAPEEMAGGLEHPREVATPSLPNWTTWTTSGLKTRTQRPGRVVLGKL